MFSPLATFRRRAGLPVAERLDRVRCMAIGVAIGAAGMAGCLLSLHGCAPTAPADFRSPDPASRLRAIEMAARTGDMTAIPRLIESLDSVDPAVRMMAFEALRSMTGEACGYREGDTPERRAEAIARWEDLARARGWVAQEPPA